MEICDGNFVFSCVFNQFMWLFSDDGGQNE